MNQCDVKAPPTCSSVLGAQGQGLLSLGVMAADKQPGRAQLSPGRSSSFALFFPLSRMETKSGTPRPGKTGSASLPGESAHACSCPCCHLGWALPSLPGTPKPPPSQGPHPKMPPGEDTRPQASQFRETWVATGQGLRLCQFQLLRAARASLLTGLELGGPQVRPQIQGLNTTFSWRPVAAGRRTGQLSGPVCQGPAPTTSPPPTASPPNAIPEVRICMQESRGTQTLGGPTFLSHCWRKGCTISQVISGQCSPSVYQEDSVTPS